jgi:hypothetical protein
MESPRERRALAAFRPLERKSKMSNKTFLVRFKPAELLPQVVIAERAEFQGDHLVFLNAAGQFVALFLTDIVESWSEFEQPNEEGLDL